MKHTYTADFYHGWLIEVTQVESGFQSVCYSPCRRYIGDETLYTSDIEAIKAARQKINWLLAHHSLAVLLRDLYETDRLSFEEWHSLSQSLNCALRTI